MLQDAWSFTDQEIAMSETRATYAGETPEETQMFIRDESPHDHYSQIPNIVDDMHLSPYAYRLYGHLRRVAGENGKCWQSTTTLAAACDMSAGKISDAKRELENTYPPLIRIVSKVADGKTYHEIAVTDIWTLNHRHFTGETVHHMNPSKDRSPHERDRSPHERKNNPVKKNPLSAEKISKIKQSADKAVDHILETDRRATGKSWTTFPEPYHPYAKAFCEATGLSYHKKYMFDWIATFDEWISDGFQPNDVRRAVEACKGKTDISRPGSITFKLRAQKVLVVPQELEMIW